MDGLSRQSLPPVERFFVSSRLAEDLLSSVYERLLGTGKRQEKWAERGRSSDNDKTEHEAMEIFTTGGRS